MQNKKPNQNHVQPRTIVPPNALDGLGSTIKTLKADISDLIKTINTIMRVDFVSTVKTRGIRPGRVMQCDEE